MQVNMRREQRRKSNAAYTLSWEDRTGFTRTSEAVGIDISKLGVRVRCLKPIDVGTQVYIQGHDNNLCGHSTVRHCSPGAEGYEIGFQLAETPQTAEAQGANSVPDYYEFLQISPRAEQSTIQRIYRFMASRFHPDNPETGDPEKFVLLNRAYAVLSDPEQRAMYDATRETVEIKPNPIFEMREFVNGIEGEMNRRLGVLSLLYNQRRTNPDNPRVSLYDLEKRMGWPREYLDFTTWYLRSRQYVTREDNADFTLTAAGVDYVETNYTEIPMLHKLLNSGSKTATSANEEDDQTFRRGPLLMGSASAETPPVSESPAPAETSHGE